MFPKTVQPHSSLYTALALRKDSQFGKFINHLMLPHLKIFSKDKEKKNHLMWGPWQREWDGSKYSSQRCSKQDADSFMLARVRAMAMLVSAPSGLELGMSSGVWRELLSTVTYSTWWRSGLTDLKALGCEDSAEPHRRAQAVGPGSKMHQIKGRNLRNSKSCS